MVAVMVARILKNVDYSQGFVDLIMTITKAKGMN